MQILKFVACSDLVVRIPFAVQFIGAPSEYVNRSKRMMQNGAWGYPADAEPYEVDASSKEAARLILLTVRDGALLPFDEQTAAACGTKFVAVDWLDGEWLQAKPAKLKKVANEV